MKRVVFAVCVLIALTAGVALAADITGKWSGEMSGPDGGGGFTLTYEFKQDGAKLTGTLQGPQGEPLELKEGKVDGDKVSFYVTFEGGGNPMKITNEGTISGDEIKITSKFEGGGDFPPSTISLKRVK